MRKLVWENSYEKIRMRKFVRENSYEKIRMRKFVWGNSYEKIRMRKFVWENSYEKIRMRKFVCKCDTNEFVSINFLIRIHSYHIVSNVIRNLQTIPKVIIFLFPLNVYALNLSVWSNLMFSMRNSYTPKLWVITHWRFEITHREYLKGPARPVHLYIC